MGRLTLNVLLSFAQFEREVTSERIRDKIAASKRRGLWVGGMVPLGYDTKDRKISINESEAELVRTIFRRYLNLGSINLLVADLRKSGLVTKARTLRTGGTVGGIPFGRGMLAHVLRNRFYIGEVAFKGEVLAGEQPAIVDRTLFDAVQAKLTEQLNNHTTTRMKSDALLVGRIFDDRGNRMSPSHARKRGVKYRYYLSSALLEGRHDQSGSTRRVPAAEIEALVAEHPERTQQLATQATHMGAASVRHNSTLLPQYAVALTDLETRLMALMADHGMDVIDPEKPIEELYDYILDWAFRDLHLMAQALGLAPPAASNEKSEA
jgi:hypothetical protein